MSIEIAALELKQALSNAQAIIDKSYLEQLSSLAVAPPSREITDITMCNCGYFFRLERLVTNKEENFLDKLVTVANAISFRGCSLTTIVDSDGSTINYYVGVISKRYRQKATKTLREADAEAFSGALTGNFSGSTLSALSKEQTQALQKHLFEKEKSVASISSIVSLRNKNDRDSKTYVQGLENLANSLRGKKYTIVMIADPVNSEQIRIAKQGYEMLYTQLSPLQGFSLTMNESKSFSLTESQTTGITKGISEGTTLSQFNSTNTGRSSGYNAVVSGGVPFGVFNVSAGASFQNNKGESIGTSFADSLMHNWSENSQDTKAVGIGREHGNSLQINTEDRSIKSLMDKINLYIERLDACDNYGAFECAAYVLTDKCEDALTVAGHYNALMRGDDSFVQSSQVSIWSPIAIGFKDTESPPHAGQIIQYLQSFSHPEFLPYKYNPEMKVRPSSLISGKEVAIQFALPKKSVNGLTVIEMIPFGRNVPHIDNQKKSIKLGELYYMGLGDGLDVPIDVNSLTAHTFITGSTGSGKSNTLYHILNELVNLDDSGKQPVKFMVIEPAKGEYKDVFGDRVGVNVWGTNLRKTRVLQLNPFAFPETIHVLEHIDRLVEVFNACWPMYAAMPAILKTAIEKSYEYAGWNLKTFNNPKRFPTFETLIDILPQVIKKLGYSTETSSDYIGALVARVSSLTNGISGTIFCNEEEIEPKELFNENAIIDLSLIGSAETKALIMAIILLKLQEHRMYEREKYGIGTNKELRHITVLEEAHHLLRRTSSEQSQESANLQGKSVEMLANAIAEMRTYGEGFIIADQSPGLMDLSVIRNTNTKIILRLPDESDRQLVGKAAGLNNEQVAELSKLEVGVAAVSQSNWHEAVLCRVNEFTDDRKKPLRYNEKWTNPEIVAIKKCLNGIFGINVSLSTEDIALIRKWSDHQENEEIYRISELSIEKADLSYVDKLIFIREIVGDKLTRITDKKLAIDKATTYFISKFDLPGDDEIIKCIGTLIDTYFRNETIIETEREENFFGGCGDGKAQ